jgi:hypothetical protein
MPIMSEVAKKVGMQYIIILSNIPFHINNFKSIIDHDTIYLKKSNM